METSGERLDDSSNEDSWSDESGGGGEEEEADELGLSRTVGLEDERAFEVLSPSQVIEKQQQAISRVRHVLPTVPIGTARIMLQHFKWDASKMLEEYTSNPARLRSKLGLSNTEEIGSRPCEKSGMCLICLSDEELMGEECGHQFCIYCWRDFLHKEVKLKHTVILCPGKDCSKVLDELTVIGYLDDEDTKDRFRETLVQSFVDDNQLVRWCPAANCTNAIVLHEVLESKNEGVTCTCGMTFCFRCGVETDHRPNSCRVFAEWTKKQGGGDTSLNDQLIATISRQCPKCNTSIQKNGGCNHMKCTFCSYHFCWQCMAKFGSGPKGGPDGYNTHRCNRPYEDDKGVSLQKEELARFYWHGDRYNNHARSLNLELKLLANAPNVVAALSRQFGMSAQTCKFYTTALQQLVDNRRLLLQSYVFGYFRPMYAKNVNRDIFENLQLDLELHTEKLSHILEDTLPAAIKNSSQAILHLTQVAKNVYHGLMDSVNEWSATGAVTSPPHSPPLRSSKSSHDLQARASGAAAPGAGNRRKGSQFLKKLFRRASEVDVAAGGNNNNAGNNPPPQPNNNSDNGVLL